MIFRLFCGLISGAMPFRIEFIINKPMRIIVILRSSIYFFFWLFHGILFDSDRTSQWIDTIPGTINEICVHFVLNNGIRHFLF